MKHRLWDTEARQRLFIYLTPATDQAKVLVGIYVASGEEELRSAERYVWSWEAPRALEDEVVGFTLDHLAVMVETILQRQTLMDGEPLSLDTLEDPST